MFKRQTFQELSDIEFEDLVNDLLGLELGCRIERFKQGKDLGIDGRFSEFGKKGFIQSKHYYKSGLPALLSIITREENKKAQKLNPSRYIFATSVQLSPEDKAKIKKAFSLIELDEADIFGADELNALLERHGEVYKRCFKLWAQSSHILELFIHPETYSKEIALINRIEKNKPLYVETSDVEAALEILKNEHVVIITGDPGVGKTSLAEHLCHIYINSGYSVHVIESDISQAPINLTDKEKPTLYYFDDFIGSNYFDAVTNANGSSIINFISQIRQESHKKLILTSRSSIVSLAQFTTQAFRNYRLADKQYIISVHNLSELVRAKILYSHLWHSRIDFERKREVATDGFYWKVIRHKNFNPRLIAFSVDSDRIGKGSACESLHRNLDNPEEIWEHCFLTQCDEYGRIIAKLCTANGGRIPETRLQEAYYKAVVGYNAKPISNIGSDFSSNAKIVTGSLVNRNIDGSKIEYTHFNPSISDFIIKRIANTFDAKILIDALDSVEVVSFYGTILAQDSALPSAAKSEIANFILNKYSQESDGRFFHSLLAALRTMFTHSDTAAAISAFEKIALNMRGNIPGISSATLLEICKILVANNLTQEAIETIVAADEFDVAECAELFELAGASEANQNLRILLKAKVYETLHDMIEDYITGDDDFKNCSTENDLHALKESVKTGIKDAYPMLHPEEIEEIFGNVDDASLLEKIDEMNDRADNSSYYPRGDGIQQSHWSVVHEVDRIFSGLS